LIYLLDTNAVSDLIAHSETVTRGFDDALREHHTVGLCNPVLFELRRGFIWRRSTAKERVLNEIILPRLELIPIIDTNWQQAAQFWADAARRGKQLSDVDLLIAALTHRLGVALISADDNFDTLPIQGVNWRTAQPS
jgi:predicted nucleic acid-binding protein